MFTPPPRRDRTTITLLLSRPGRTTSAELQNLVKRAVRTADPDPPGSARDLWWTGLLTSSMNTFVGSQSWKQSNVTNADESSEGSRLVLRRGLSPSKRVQNAMRIGLRCRLVVSRLSNEILVVWFEYEPMFGQKLGLYCLLGGFCPGPGCHQNLLFRLLSGSTRMAWHGNRATSVL